MVGHTPLGAIPRRLGPYTTMGAMSTVLPESVVEYGAVVGDCSLVMKVRVLGAAFQGFAAGAA